MSAEDAEKYWNQSLEFVESCPTCGGVESFIKYAGLQDCLEALPGEWSIWSCASCDCLFLNPRPKMDSIYKAYRTYYTHDSAVDAEFRDSGNSLIWSLANGYLNARYNTKRFPAVSIGRYLIPLIFPLRQQLDFFMRHLPTISGRLLDVGCGNGRFLMRARSAGWNVVGLEPDPLAVRAVEEIGIAVRQGTLDYVSFDEPFDLVTASHVIEHVHNPREFLSGILKNLKPGGTLWLATPNAGGFGRRWFRSSWRGFEPPRHMVLFSLRTLRILLIRAGFVDIQFQCRGRGANYIFRASGEISAKQIKKIRFSPSPILVDVAASLFVGAAEELVVTAKRSIE